MIPVTGTGRSASAPFAPAAPGTYVWSASYSGDADYSAVGPTCAAAGLSTVSKASPTLTTMASGTTTLGSSVSDTASLAGGYQARGSVTFELFRPADLFCTGTPVGTATVKVNGDGSYSSGPLTPTAAGRYRFLAGYSGDADNNLVTAGACGLASETVTVVAAPLTTTSTTTSTTAARTTLTTGTSTATATATAPA